MKTNFILTIFILGLVGLAVYVYAMYPIVDGDRINQQQLDKQLAYQKGRLDETQQKYSGFNQDNQRILTDNVSTASLQPQLTIKIKNNQFTPAQVIVNVGTTIIWENEDIGFHQISQAIEKNPVIKPDSLESSSMRPGDSYSFTFTKAGVYDYHCDLNPKMLGQIRVVD